MQVGGIVGNILTGIFAQKHIAKLDGQEILGGWMDGNWMQVPYQIADSAAGLGWSFLVTYIILFCMNKIPGLSLRAEISVERIGLDQGELGLSCYEYVEEVRGNGSTQEMDKTNGRMIGMNIRLYDSLILKLFFFNFHICYTLYNPLFVKYSAGGFYAIKPSN